MASLMEMRKNLNAVYRGIIVDELEMLRHTPCKTVWNLTKLSAKMFIPENINL